MRQKPWQIPCSVCGRVSFTDHREFHFCEDCWDDYRRLQSHVDWMAEPSFLVQYLKGKQR